MHHDKSDITKTENVEGLAASAERGEHGLCVWPPPHDDQRVGQQKEPC